MSKKEVNVVAVDEVVGDKYRLNELKADIDKFVIEYNDLLATKDVTQKQLKECDNKIADKVSEYAKMAQLKCFDECKAEPDPMLEAVKRLTFEVLKVKDVNEGTKDAPVWSRKVETAEKAIDLTKLYGHCGSIGVDAQWIYMAQKFNCMFTMQRCTELGVDPKEVNDSFAMERLARDVDLGKTPCSKTNFKKTLQSLINAMVGQYKITDHDVRFISMAYQKKSKKALTITTSNNKQLIGLLAEVCHKLVCGKTYSVDYKKATK